METLNIEAQDKSPAFFLDPHAGQIKITGISDDEDAMGTYFPVLQWLDAYVKAPAEKTTVELDLKYYNTASAKSLFEVLKRISRIQETGQTVEVKWYHEAGDDNMVEEIENFADIANLSIQAVEKS